MYVEIFVALGLGLTVGCSFLAFYAFDVHKKHRMYLDFTKEALEILKAQSLEEKVRIEAQKKQYDIQLEYMRDTMSREKAKLYENEKPTPQLVTTETGEQVDLSEYDVIS